MTRFRRARILPGFPLSTAKADQRESKRVPNKNQGQLTIWGRANSVNVQKDEIDDPLLKSVEDEVHQYWERQQSAEEKKVCPRCGHSEYLSAVEKWSNTDKRFETTYACSICDSGKRKEKAGRTTNQIAGVEKATGSGSSTMIKNKGLLDNLFDKIQKHLFGGDK